MSNECPETPRPRRPYTMTPAALAARQKVIVEARKFPRRTGDTETDTMLHILYRLERLREKVREAERQRQQMRPADPPNDTLAVRLGDEAVSRIITYLYNRLCPSRPGRPRKAIPPEQWGELMGTNPDRE